MDEIVVELAKIRDEFNEAKESFLQRYEQSVQDWIDKHPQWEDIIANSIVSEDYVRSRMDFRWQMFRVASPHEADPGPKPVRVLANCISHSQAQGKVTQ